MKEYQQSSEAVLSSLSTVREGLSEGEATLRAAKYGANKLTERKKAPLWRRFLAQLAEPMTIILIAAAAVSGIMSVVGDESAADVFIILSVVIINSALGVIQEAKAEGAIEALKKITSASCKVIRDGEQRNVDSSLLVPGDIVVLEAGDVVPADCRLIECHSLRTDESTLTGESLPIEKTIEVIDGDAALGDRRNCAFSGTSIVYGRGIAVVTDVGMSTEIGRIAGAISASSDGETPLSHRLKSLSKLLTALVLGICALIFTINIIRLIIGGEIGWDAAIDTLMIAVSLAVAAIPEGLAAVVTIVLSVGVTGMSRRGAVIRRLTAVETLGCANIICSDKTGTLTQNRMTVTEWKSTDKMLLCLAVSLCSDAVESSADSVVGEPTEAALVRFALSEGYRKSEYASKYPRIAELPFDSDRKMMSTFHMTENENKIGALTVPNGYVVQFVKGAPDALLPLCTGIFDASVGVDRAVTDADRAAISTENKNMADRALRVLAAAYKIVSDGGRTEENLVYIGLVGMIDPIRPEVKAAIDECKAAGIRPVMITGDHLDTAVAIARELGILQSGDDSDGIGAITGAMLDQLSDAELAERVERYSVYARVQPEHKTRVVRAWQSRSMIVSMTGDGVNDAPSLKAADIGVGMGITGTDVSRGVADMVLSDDNFATIVAAVREGRRIYDNIKKAIAYLLSSNLAEVIAIFTASLIGFTLLRPVHLIWINLITDCFPALALGMEKSENDVMCRPPRSAKEGLFAGRAGFDTIFHGVILAAITLAAYYIGENFGGEGMTMAFLTLSLSEIFHSFNMRSQRGSIFTLKRQNGYLWSAAALSVILTAGVVLITPVRGLFGFDPISAWHYAAALGLGFVIIAAVEIEKAAAAGYTRLIGSRRI